MRNFSFTLLKGELFNLVNYILVQFVPCTEEVPRSVKTLRGLWTEAPRLPVGSEDRSPSDFRTDQRGYHSPKNFPVEHLTTRRYGVWGDVERKTQTELIPYPFIPTPGLKCSFDSFLHPLPLSLSPHLLREVPVLFKFLVFSFSPLNFGSSVTKEIKFPFLDGLRVGKLTNSGTYGAPGPHCQGLIRARLFRVTSRAPTVSPHISSAQATVNGSIFIFRYVLPWKRFLSVRNVVRTAV